MSKLNFKPRTIFCRDNLDVLSGMNSGCIDLIYLDPPFNKNKVFTAPMGGAAEGASFKDTFREEDVKDEWVKSIEYENTDLYFYLAGVKMFSSNYNYCYLVYMAVRLLECRRVLKDTGSIYLHCDPTMSHYLKIVMDCVFGEKNFRNEIVWGYSGGGTPKKDYPRKHDIIFRYAKTGDFVFNREYKPYKANTRAVGKHSTLSGGGDIDLDRGTPVTDWWMDTKTVTGWAPEKTSYPTQKPLALLERIISASSNEGDMVLDPFCGCATTCVAAEKLRRQWVGVDVSDKAQELVDKRLKAMYEEQSESSFTHPLLLGRYVKAFARTAPPKRDMDAAKEGGGYVYVIGNAAYPNEWKVGIAKEPEKRLAGYQTADPKRGYALAGAVLTPHYREVERAVHKRFGAAHEWVKAESAQAVISAIKSAASKLERARKPRRRAAGKPRRRR